MIHILLSILSMHLAFAGAEAIAPGPYTFNYPDPTGRTATSRTDNIQILHSAHLQNNEIYIRYRNPSDTRCPNQICGRSVNINQLERMDGGFWAQKMRAMKVVGSMGMWKDVPPCAECEAARLATAQPRVQAGSTVTMEIPAAQFTSRYPLSSAENFLHHDSDRKIDCKGRILLHQSRDILMRAEQAFNLPAASIACLIGKESKWSPAAKSGTGYMGLAQTISPNINTLKTWLTPPNAPYDSMLARQWARATNNQPISDLTLSNIYRTTAISAADQRKMANVSIGFVGVYLNFVQKRHYERVVKKFGANVAYALAGSDTLRAIAYVAYNAGHGNADDMIPDEAYLTPYLCQELNANRTPRNLPRGFTRAKCGNNELSWVRNIPTNSTSSAVRTQAIDYVNEIHRCESSQWISAAPAEAARRPKDECGL